MAVPMNWTGRSAPEYRQGGQYMSATNVARVTDVIAESPKSFEDAVQVGFKKAAAIMSPG